MTNGKSARGPASSRETAPIRIGIGGWEFAPWRETFYPPGLASKDRLKHVGEVLTSTEINATFHRTQSPASFARWAAETPEGFRFAVKAQRGATHRSVLAEAGPSIEHFLASGIDRLGDKLGPILWQIAPNKMFRADDLGAFLKLLPKELAGRRLHHALEAQHASFAAPEAIDLLRSHNVARVVVDAPGKPPISDVTADFVYLRLKGSLADEPDGYPADALGRWAQRMRAYAEGKAPADLPCLGAQAGAAPRPVFAYVIAGAKERAPAAALALTRLIAGEPVR